MFKKYKADPFRLENALCDFIDEVAKEKIKEHEICAMINGRKVAASLEFLDGIILVHIETPVKFL